MARKEEGGRGWLVGLFVSILALGLAYAGWLSLGAPGLVAAPTPTPAGRIAATEPPTSTSSPIWTPRSAHTPQVSATPSPTVRPFKVGIVAGHWQSDVGAMCDDGLTEVSINLDVGSRVVAILQYQGYEAELLPEYAEELNGYVADAFVSIHADACNVPSATGFKVAHVAASAIPGIEDRLVACLIKEYGRTTGLPFHKNSITYDMTAYHAFGEIDPQTPGAIIELGFMGADRELLTENSYKVAQGVARGIICFLEGE